MEKKNVLSVKEINFRIDEEFCKVAFKSLSDESLNKNYNESKALRKRIIEIEDAMKEVQISDEKIEDFIQIYRKKIIPPGVKGNYRGKKFNLVVKEKIKNMKLNKNNFTVKFEKNNTTIQTGEIPDWFIEDKKTGKIIIGMNQTDLWGGGMQKNRGDKYIIQTDLNTDKSKLLAVVCNHVKISKRNTKIYNLLNKGFQNDTLCYLNNLENIINTFFNL